MVEGTIQRFEVVVELLWKTVRRALKHEGVFINPDTPREAMIQGLSAGFLHDEVIWQSLLDKPNKTSHEYLDGAFINESYEDILTLAPEIEKVLLFLEGRFS